MVNAGLAVCVQLAVSTASRFRSEAGVKRLRCFEVSCGVANMAAKYRFFKYLFLNLKTNKQTK